MTRFSENIAHLRRLRGFSQEEMAKELKITRSRLGAYEEGRSEPPLALLIRIADFFKLPVDAFIRNDLTKTDSESFIDIGNNRILFPIMINDENKDRIEVVPHKASAGYLHGYSDPEYIANLPVMNLPFVPTGKHRAFQIEGDSMEPLVKAGSYVIGKYIETPQQIKNGKTYVLITKNDGMVYKRIYVDKDKKDVITLHSDNPDYAAYDIHLGEVLEIWEHTCNLNLQDYKPEELNWGSIVKMMRELKIELQENNRMRS